MRKSHTHRKSTATHDEVYTPRYMVDRALDCAGHNFVGKRIISPCDSPSSAYVWAMLDRAKELKWRAFRHCWRRADGSGSFVDYAMIDGTPEKVDSGDWPVYSWADENALRMYGDFDILFTNPPFSMIYKNIVPIARKIRVCVMFMTGAATGRKMMFDRCTLFRGGGDFLSPDGTRTNIHPMLLSTIPMKNFIHTPTKRLKDIDYYIWKDGIRVYTVNDIPIDYNGKIYAPFNAHGGLDPDFWEFFDVNEDRKRWAGRYKELWGAGVKRRAHKRTEEEFLLQIQSL